MTDVPEIGRLVDEILSSAMSEEQARGRYPDVIQWFKDRFPLVEMLQEDGVELKPLSADAPGVFVGECPLCVGSTT